MLSLRPTRCSVLSTPVRNCLLRPFGHIARALLSWCVIGILIVPVLSEAQASTSAPNSDLLYVVDSNGGQTSSQILVVDADRRVVIRTYKAGFHPDIAVSPDGKRLYIAYDVLKADGNQMGVLDVADTQTGAIVVTVDNSDRWLAIGDLYSSTMAISPDGRWLYSYKYKEDPNGGVWYGVAVFDANRGKFLPDQVALPMCNAPQLIPYAADKLAVLCNESRSLYIISLRPDGTPVRRIPPETPIPNLAQRHNTVASALLRDREQQFLILMDDGSYFVGILPQVRLNDNGSLKLQPSIKRDLLSLNSPTRSISGAPISAGRFIGFNKVVATGNKMFVPFQMSAPDFRFSDEVAVINIKSLVQEGSINPVDPFWSVSTSVRGDRLYLTDPIRSRIHVIDTSTLEEIGSVAKMGLSPTIVIASMAPN
jgi:DNA-binding beta-propeller fold protein YncE